MHTCKLVCLTVSFLCFIFIFSLGLCQCHCSPKTLFSKMTCYESKASLNFAHSLHQLPPGRNKTPYVIMELGHAWADFKRKPIGSGLNLAAPPSYKDFSWFLWFSISVFIATCFLLEKSVWLGNSMFWWYPTCAEFGPNFQIQGVAPNQPFSCRKTRMIDFAYSIKCGQKFLSFYQNARVWRTDRQISTARLCVCIRSRAVKYRLTKIYALLSE